MVAAVVPPNSDVVPPPDEPPNKAEVAGGAADEGAAERLLKREGAAAGAEGAPNRLVLGAPPGIGKRFVINKQKNLVIRNSINLKYLRQNKVNIVKSTNFHNKLHMRRVYLTKERSAGTRGSRWSRCAEQRRGSTCWKIYLCMTETRGGNTHSYISIELTYQL